MNRQLINAMAAQYATPEVSGNGLVSWEDGKKCVIPSVKLYGAAVQDGTPTPDTPVMSVCNNGVFAVRGRNLLDLPRETTLAEMGNESGSRTIRIRLPAGASVTLGRWVRYNAADNATTRRLTLMCTYQDGTYKMASTTFGLYENDGQWHYESISVTPEQPVESIFVRLADYSSASKRDCGIRDAQLVIGAYTTDTMPPYTPYYDGGQAQAPELWAADGVADEWDAATGKGVRRVLALRITGDMLSKQFQNGRVYVNAALFSPKDYRNRAALCTHFAYNNNVWADSGTKNGFMIHNGQAFLRNTDWETREDAVAWFDANEVYVYAEAAAPEPFYSPPAKLTMPSGYGQIIQTSGDVPDCPITARYLKHS